MKNIVEKYEILMLRAKINNTSEVSRMTGISRNTISKYWNEHCQNLELLRQQDPGADTRDLIQQIVDTPKYDVSSRVCVKYNSDIDALLNTILDDEERKNERLGKYHKQKLTNTQIHALIVAQGYDIGLSTINNRIREKRNTKREAFIKQEYSYGDRFEYDFGEVNLYIDGKPRKGQIAVLSLPSSGFRWAYLYHNQKMEVFLDSHVRFFEMLGGSFRSGVYDNMKNVVARFVGRNEKEYNKELLKLSLYYGFEIITTNCRKGNEKGTVESSVKWIRNKVFSYRYEFHTFEEAASYLQEQLEIINTDSSIEEEKQHLSEYLPKYESAEISTAHVDTYSFIQIETNQYSVPDDLVGKEVLVKKYPDVIEVYFNKHKQCTHTRSYERHKICLDIMHYLDTFKRKPGALKNSLALRSEPELNTLYDTYFKTNPKDFIEVLFKNAERSIEDIIDIVKNKHAVIKEERVVTQKTDEQIAELQKYFIGGNEYVH
jgi:transposase